jgi:hypothetical protein
MLDIFQCVMECMTESWWFNLHFSISIYLSWFSLEFHFGQAALSLFVDQCGDHGSDVGALEGF